VEVLWQPSCGRMTVGRKVAETRETPISPNELKSYISGHHGGQIPNSPAQGGLARSGCVGQD